MIVVNEALSPDGSLAKSFIYEGLGNQDEFMLDLIDDAFRWARSADPNASLYYNENKVEGSSSSGISQRKDLYNSVKSDKMYKFLYDLKVNRKVPIDGVGLQAHFNAAGTGLGRAPHPENIQTNLHRLTSAPLNFDVNISEMDVRISKLPSTISREQRISAQKQIYDLSLDACFRNNKFKGVTFWGFTVSYWMHFYLVLMEMGIYLFELYKITQFSNM